MLKIISITILLTLLSGGVSTVSAKIDELPLKAMFLEAAVRFITWPADSSNGQHFRSGDIFTIGVFEKEGLSPYLKKAFFKKKIRGSDVRFMLITQLSHVDSCDLIFIPESKKYILPDILDKTRNRAVLTVSDVPEFIEAGTMLGIVMQDQKVNCIINRTVADHLKIRISYHLLQKSRVYPESTK